MHTPTNTKHKQVQPFPADQRLFYPGTRVVQPASATEGLSGDIIMAMPLLDLNNGEAERSLEKLVSE